MNAHRQICDADVSAFERREDDGLQAPMNQDRTRERLAMADAYLAQNPVILRPGYDVAEIIGVRRA